MEVLKILMRKKKEDEHAFAEFSSAHRRSEAKCQLVETSYKTRINLNVLVCHIISILLTELSRSVWENLNFGHVYRPHYVIICQSKPVGTTAEIVIKIIIIIMAMVFQNQQTNRTRSLWRLPFAVRFPHDCFLLVIDWKLEGF